MSFAVISTVSGVVGVLCLFAGGGGRELRLLTDAASTSRQSRQRAGLVLFRIVPSWMLALALAAIVAALVSPRMALWILSASILAGTLVWLMDCGRRDRQRTRNRAAVMRACGALVGQIEIGELPSQALQVLAQDEPMFVPAAGAALVGGDPVAALRALGTEPGCSGVAQLAFAWELCQRTGMSLGTCLSRVITELIAETELETARESELASALSTGRLLAGLPLVGLGMGFIVGADPLAFLSSGIAGQLCVLGASLFASAGLIWTQKLSQSSETRPPIVGATPAVQLGQVSRDEGAPQ